MVVHRRAQAKPSGISHRMRAPHRKPIPALTAELPPSTRSRRWNGPVPEGGIQHLGRAPTPLALLACYLARKDSDVQDCHHPRQHPAPAATAKPSRNRSPITHSDANDAEFELVDIADYG